MRAVYGTWSGRKELYVDGRSVAQGASLATSWEHELELLERSARVRLRLRWLVYPEAWLELDGEPVAPSAAPRSLPPWVWAFVIANLAIVAVARGGALPGGFAGAGAAACLTLSRGRWSTAVRLALCAASTAAAWGGFGLLWRLAAG